MKPNYTEDGFRTNTHPNQDTSKINYTDDLINKEAQEKLPPKENYINTQNNDRDLVNWRLDKEEQIHQIGVDKANQLHKHKDIMFNWIISMSSFYLVIVLIIFFLTVFEIKPEFLSGRTFVVTIISIASILVISILLIPYFGKKINDLNDNIIASYFVKKLQNLLDKKIKGNNQMSAKEYKISAETEVIVIFLKQLLNFRKYICTIILGCLVGFIYLMLSKIINMRPSAEINSSIIIALITSTTGTVIALPALVAKIIFDDKK